MARTKHLSVLHGFRSGLDRSNPFGSGFVAPRCFQLDGGETLFLAEVPSNVKGGTRFVSFVSVFKLMVASYFKILESRLRARVDGRTDTRANASAGKRRRTSALTNGRVCGRASGAAAHG